MIPGDRGVKGKYKSEQKSTEMFLVINDKTNRYIFKKHHACNFKKKVRTLIITIVKCLKENERVTSLAVIRASRKETGSEIAYSAPLSIYLRMIDCAKEQHITKLNGDAK